MRAFWAAVSAVNGGSGGRSMVVLSRGVARAQSTRIGRLRGRRAVHIRVSVAKTTPSDASLAGQGRGGPRMEDLLQFMQDADPDMVKVAVLAFAMACRELNATDTSAVI